LPDTEPPAAWRELRMSLPGGMVSLRREGDGLAVVVWGNADDGLRQLWNALAWAFAKVGEGTIITESGPLTAVEFKECNAM
jgi:hypothetical protein